MSKSKKVDNPDTEEEANEVLADVVNTNEVNSKEQANSGHQLPVTQLVEKNARNNTGEKVDNATEKRILTLRNILCTDLIPPAMETI